MVEEDQNAGLTRDGTARRVNAYPDALTPDPSPSGRTASEGRFSTPPKPSDAVFLFSAALPGVALRLVAFPRSAEAAIC